MAEDLLLVVAFLLVLTLGAFLVERVVPAVQDWRQRRRTVVRMEDWLAEANQRPRVRLW